VRRQTIESRRGTRCADGLLPPQPHQLQPARALSSHDRPRSLFKRVSTPSFVSRSHREPFRPRQTQPSPNRPDPYKRVEDWTEEFLAASQVLLSFLLFCRSSLSNDDVLRKAFCGTPLTCSRRYHRIPSRARVYLCVRIGFAGPCTYFCYDV
jgi:hypothetical protein